MHYGKDVVLELGVTLAEDNTDTAIEFDINNGIVIGNSSESNLKTYLQYYCSNATTPQELALEMELSLMLVIDFSLKDFEIQV